MRSTSIHRPAAMAMALGLTIAMPAPAAPTIFWPSFAATPAGVAAPALIGTPDLAWQTDPAQAAKFDRRVNYPTLAAEMGLSDADIARYDLIAWESNGGSPGSSGGFESTTFVFDDLRVALLARYDEVTDSSSNPAVRFLSGSIAGSRFDATFGTHGAEAVMSWLLIDLPVGIDARSSSFSVSFQPGGLSPGGLGEGSPDIDAIGVIRAVPEPSTWGMVCLGLLALCGAAPRRPGAV